MKCEKCKAIVDNRIGLAMDTLHTHGKMWCRACLIAAGGFWPEVPAATSDIEERMRRERAQRIAASQLHQERRKVNEKRTLRRKVKKTAKERKNATLLITKLLRT